MENPLKSPGLPGLIAATALVLAVGTGFGEARAADPDVVATWTGGIHVLPGTATRSGNNEEIPFEDETPEQWSRRITQDVVKPGVKVPAVIYAHGCKGPLAAGTYYFPVFSGVAGHLGPYQLHITVDACPIAACCETGGSGLS